MAFTFFEWSQTLHSSISALSRTAKGLTESAYGAKSALDISGPELETVVKNNLQHSIEYVWAKGPRVHKTPPAIRGFMNAVAKQVSFGLVDPAHIYRVWDTSAKYPAQVAPKDIEHEMRHFCDSVASSLYDERHAIFNAAWVERELDYRIHPFADGCGRTAKLLGAWVLLRAGLPPARFTDRDEYYAAMNAGQNEWAAYYRSKVLLR